MYIYPENSVILAPLSGHTDWPYRHSARRWGCKYAFTEMIDAGALIYGNEKTLKFLDRGSQEDWLGVQLIGSDPEMLFKSTEIINRYDFDVLDLNLGCPAPKVFKKGEGAALAARKDAAVKAFETIEKVSRIPVTAKIRILDEENPEPTIELVKALEQSGAQAITVHGRIRTAYYSGSVFYNIINCVRQELSIQTIANGGVSNVDNYDQIRNETGCDSVMVATGAMGNPWLFKEIIERKSYTPPTVKQFVDELRQHVLDMIEIYGEPLALKVSRKIILDYMRGRGFPGELKRTVSFLKTEKEFEEFLVKLSEGPSYRYWAWLETEPNADRRLNGGKK